MLEVNKDWCFMVDVQMVNGRESPAWSNSTSNARTPTFIYNYNPHSGTINLPSYFCKDNDLKKAPWFIAL